MFTNLENDKTNYGFPHYPAINYIVVINHSLQGYLIKRETY